MNGRVGIGTATPSAKLSVQAGPGIPAATIGGWNSATVVMLLLWASTQMPTAITRQQWLSNNSLR